MSKKFQRLLNSIEDVSAREQIAKAIPEIYQKQFMKFLVGAKKVKPFFMKWLGKNQEARQVLDLVLRSPTTRSFLTEARNNVAKDEPRVSNARRSVR